MLIAGSCQCGKVKFTARSETPTPFMYCYCSICRKCSGGAFGCNIMAIRSTLKLTGKRFLRAYHARVHRRGKPTEISEGERVFCTNCGTHLYVQDDRWSEGIWPNVGAIDSELPAAPEHVHMMTRYKPRWVPERFLEDGPRYPEYPKLSIMAWHEQHGMRVRPDDKGKGKSKGSGRTTTGSKSSRARGKKKAMTTAGATT